MQTFNSVKKQLSDILSRVQGAATLLGSNQSIDITGLDKQVSQVCEAVKTLSPQDQSQLKNDMLSLTDEVSRLTDNLKNRQEEIRKMLEGTSTHSKAAKAYSPKKPGS